jgi:hypothetical protein
MLNRNFLLTYFFFSLFLFLFSSFSIQQQQNWNFYNEIKAISLEVYLIII